MNWFSQFFLNPGLVIPGLALASLPVLIHFLSRLRYRTVRFAAMEFLLQSDELNRRRLILEQLLLLLLRVLVVLLIALLLARLVLDPSRLLMLRGSSVHHVIILDDTLSLREQRGDKTVFELAVRTLENMVSDAESQRSGARVTILAVSAPERPVISDRPLNQLLLQDINVRLRTLNATYQAGSPVPALNTARAILAADGGVSPEVHFITDFRKSDWQGKPEVIAALQSLKNINAHVQLIRLVIEPGNNAAISDLIGDTSAIARGVPWRIHVEIHNHGTNILRGLRARILVDGIAMPASILFPDLDSSETLTISHDITFQNIGTHRVEVRLDDDVLLADNRRFLTVDVTEKRQILILDDEPQQEDAGYVSAAISADADLTGLAAEIRTTQSLNSLNLQLYDVVYLLNVRDLPADATEVLEKYVRGGGGIAWFPGDQANTDWYQALHQDNSRRLFPVPLGPIQSADDPSHNLALIEDSAVAQYQSPIFTTHPIFSVYNTPDSPFADAVQVARWLAVAESWPQKDEDRQDGVRTLARLRNGAPIIFEHVLGKGRILTFLTGAGKRWSNWPVAPAAWGYVVLHLSMHPYLQQRTDSVRIQEISDSLVLNWPAQQFTDNVEVFLPEPEEDDDITANTFLRLQATPATSPETSAPLTNLPPATPPASVSSGSATPVAVTTPWQLTLRQANRPGIYRIRRFSTGEGQPHDTWVALNVPKSESALAAADPSQLTGLAGLSHVRIHDSGSAESISGAAGGRELRWIILAGLILALLAEQLLSLRMSHHPEGSGR